MWCGLLVFSLIRGALRLLLLPLRIFWEIAEHSGHHAGTIAIAIASVLQVTGASLRCSASPSPLDNKDRPGLGTGGRFRYATRF